MSFQDPYTSQFIGTFTNKKLDILVNQKCFDEKCVLCLKYGSCKFCLFTKKGNTYYLSNGSKLIDWWEHNRYEVLTNDEKKFLATLYYQISTDKDNSRRHKGLARNVWKQLSIELNDAL